MRNRISPQEQLKISNALRSLPNVTVESDGDLRIELSSYGNEIKLDTFVQLNYLLLNHSDLIGKYANSATSWADGDYYGGIGDVYLSIKRINL